MEVSKIGKTKHNNVNHNPFHFRRQKLGVLLSTNKKVVGALVDPPTINIACAVWDNVIAFGTRTVATSEILTPPSLKLCPPVGLRMSGGLTLGSARNFYLFFLIF